MTYNSKARFSVSTWSLHRTLGRPEFIGVEDGFPTGRPATGGVSLLDLPALVNAHGIGTMEICHFHFPSTEADYLKKLRSALDAAGIELWSILIDDGDITHAGNAERDLQWICGWIDVAAALGSKNVRVIAGKAASTPESREKSYRGFARLVEHAQGKGVRVMTENWLDTLSRPEHVQELLDRLDGQVGLCVDFGNWGGATKYENLRQIFPRAESCHTKCHFTAPNAMDRDDYVRCLDLSREANFAGPYTLIYDGPGDDEWAHLELEKEIVKPYLG